MNLETPTNCNQRLIAIGSPDGETGRCIADALRKFLSTSDVKVALMCRHLIKDEGRYENHYAIFPGIDDLYLFNKAVRILKNSLTDIGIIDFTPVEVLVNSLPAKRPVLPDLLRPMDYVVHVIPPNYLNKHNYLKMAETIKLSNRTGVIEIDKEGQEDQVAQIIARFFEVGLRVKEINAAYSETENE